MRWPSAVSPRVSWSRWRCHSRVAVRVQVAAVVALVAPVVLVVVAVPPLAGQPRRQAPRSPVRSSGACLTSLADTRDLLRKASQV